MEHLPFCEFTLPLSVKLSWCFVEPLIGCFHYSFKRLVNECSSVLRFEGNRILVRERRHACRRIVLSRHISWSYSIRNMRRRESVDIFELLQFLHSICLLTLLAHITRVSTTRGLDILTRRSKNFRIHHLRRNFSYIGVSTRTIIYLINGRIASILILLSNLVHLFL